jgi:hypothetical protein
MKNLVTYMVSLHGSEVFLLDLGGLNLHKVVEGQSNIYFLIPLKGEHHNRCQLLPCTMQMHSSIQPYECLNMLLRLKTKQGISNGPVISDENGRVFNSSNIDQAMHEDLEELLI